MLITLGTQWDWRLQLVDNLPFYTLLHSFPIENWNNMSEGISCVYHHTDKALLGFLIMAFERTQLSSFETSTIN